MFFKILNMHISFSNCVAMQNYNYMAFLSNADGGDDFHGTNTMSYHKWISSEMVGSLVCHVVNQLHYVLHETLCVHHH